MSFLHIHIHRRSHCIEMYIIKTILCIKGKYFYAYIDMIYYFNNLLSYLEIQAKDLHALVLKVSSGIIHLQASF